MKLPVERLDIGGAFGKNKEPADLAMNPDGLVPTLEPQRLSQLAAMTWVLNLTAAVRKDARRCEKGWWTCAS